MNILFKQLFLKYPRSQYSTFYTLLLTSKGLHPREESICKSSNFVSVSADIAVDKFCLVTTFPGWLPAFDACQDLKTEAAACDGCTTANPA
jgi:hypothetical protein